MYARKSKSRQCWWGRSSSPSKFPLPRYPNRHDPSAKRHGWLQKLAREAEAEAEAEEDELVNKEDQLKDEVEEEKEKEEEKKEKNQSANREDQSQDKDDQSVNKKLKRQSKRKRTGTGTYGRK